MSYCMYCGSQRATGIRCPDCTSWKPGSDPAGETGIIRSSGGGGTTIELSGFSGFLLAISPLLLMLTAVILKECGHWPF